MFIRVLTSFFFILNLDEKQTLYVQNQLEPSSSVLHCYHAHQSVVYVPEVIRAILRYLALIEMQSVVMTLSALVQVGDHLNKQSLYNQ